MYRRSKGLTDAEIEFYLNLSDSDVGDGVESPNGSSDESEVGEKCFHDTEKIPSAASHFNLLDYVMNNSKHQPECQDEDEIEARELFPNEGNQNCYENVEILGELVVSGNIFCEETPLLAPDLQINSNIVNNNDTVYEIIEEFPEDPTEKYNFTAKPDISFKPSNPFNTNKIPFVEDINDSITVLSPIDYFYKYIPEELFKEMAYYTNLYSQQNEGNLKYTFKPTNHYELQNLFGAHLMIGTMDLKQLTRYWGRSLNPRFTSKMSYKRFGQLRQNLHFVDKTEKPLNNSDKFYLVRPLINAVRNRCLQMPVEEIVSVDEQIVPFKGRLSIKQYIKGNHFLYFSILYNIIYSKMFLKYVNMFLLQESLVLTE